MDKYIYAFDPSLDATGYAVFKVSPALELIEYGTISIKKKSFPHPYKLNVIHQKIISLMAKYVEEPEYIAIERGFNRFNKATQAIYKARGSIECLFPKTRFIELSVTEIRNGLIGKAKAEKEEIKTFVEAYFKLSNITFDESDAIAVGLVAIMTMEGKNEQR